MEAKDLRIGNYFIGYSNCIEQWGLESFGLLKQGIEVDEIIRSFVPLTEDILLKCGFEVFPWGWVKKSTDDFGIRLNLNSFNYEVSGNSSVKLKYLHQVQNLFWCLCGEELSVNIQ